MLFISLILEFFVNLSNNSGWSKKYYDLVKQLEEATEDFWFIFDKPTESKERKEVLKNLVDYTNPLERLKELKSYNKT